MLCVLCGLHRALSNRYLDVSALDLEEAYTRRTVLDCHCPVSMRGNAGVGVQTSADASRCNQNPRRWCEGHMRVQCSKESKDEESRRHRIAE